MTFHSVLIANRGEIACRVIKSAKAQGYETIAVYSDADKDALHVSLADRAVAIGPPAASESYLDISKIIEACQRTGAGAVHPGYGFLSENTAFVAACEAAGIVFIGPPASAMALMGKKREAKAVMKEAGVPVVPGTEGAGLDDDALFAEAERIGMPLMIKASAGGGGRGMRLCHELSEVRENITRARSESKSAFGDDELILERAVLGAKHVEVQVFADALGNTIHLGERDCSVQRRHQKVIEEAPSPAVDDQLRQKMGAAAVRAATAIGYVGAGTVEFLLEEDGSFYFMEMNTRLQVEHPVTELVTGVDLVALQLRVAQGLPLDIEQAEVAMTGHAIEARIYAEAPWQDFMPQTGDIVRFDIPKTVRVDAGVRSGDEVSHHYDAMMAKIIAYGADRDEALRKLRRAVLDSAIFGVAHNLPFLHDVLAAPAFVRGQATTQFVDEHMDMAERPPLPAKVEALGLALCAGGPGPHPSRVPLAVVVRGERVVCHVAFSGTHAEVTPSRGSVDILSQDDDEVVFVYEGVRQRAHIQRDGAVLWLACDGHTESFARVLYSEGSDDIAGGDDCLAPMAGAIIHVSARVGARVKRGDAVCVLEAMKMQLGIEAPRDGVVDSVNVKVGDQAQARQVLVRLRPEEA